MLELLKKIPLNIFVLLVILNFFNCERDFSAIQDNKNPPIQITLEIENYYFTGIWLKLTIPNETGLKVFSILRDNVLICSDTLRGNDTIIFDPVIPSKEFNYLVQVYKNGTLIGNSDSLLIGPKVVWEPLDFEDKFALKVILAESNLYVCAGANGLWKRNVYQSTGNWEYLGLSDTTLGNSFHVGVQDVNIVGSDILVAYRPHVQPWSSVGIWRSLGGGQNWFRSDSGIPDSTWPYSSFKNARRSPNNENIALTYTAGALFQSQDGGSNWILIDGRRGAISNLDLLKWHPTDPGVVQIFGESSTFSPYLARFGEYGMIHIGYVNFAQIGVPIDNAVYDIAFDATDPNIIYVGMQGGIIKSEDDWNNWIVPLFTHPQGGFFRAIVSHPAIHNLVWFAGGRTLFQSADGGYNTQIIESPNDTQILTMVYNELTESLLIGTENGIYMYKLL